MAPETVHLHAQLIRHGVETVRAVERWAKAQPASETRSEMFRSVRFWEDVLAYARQTLAGLTREPEGDSDERTSH